MRQTSPPTELNHALLIRDLLDDVADAFPDRVKTLLELEKQVHDLILGQLAFEAGRGKLRIVVIGHFNSGKSTVINSLLGEAICPVDVCATTACVTEFRYGPREVIRTGDGRTVSRLEFEQRVKHPQENGRKTRERLRFEVEYPSNVLFDLTIVDTPGFCSAEHTEDKEVTLNEARGADAIILVHDITTPIFGDLLDILKQLRKHLKESTPFHLILNKADGELPTKWPQIRAERIADHKAIFMDATVYDAKWALETSQWRKLVEHQISVLSGFNGSSGIAIARKRLKSGLYELSFHDHEKLNCVRELPNLPSAAHLRNTFLAIASMKDEILRNRLHDSRSKYLTNARAWLDDVQQCTIDPWSIEVVVKDRNAEVTKALKKNQSSFSEAIKRAIENNARARPLLKKEKKGWFGAKATVVWIPGQSMPILRQSEAFPNLRASLLKIAKGIREGTGSDSAEKLLNGDEWDEIVDRVSRMAAHQLDVGATAFLRKTYDDLRAAEIALDCCVRSSLYDTVEPAVAEIAWEYLKLVVENRILREGDIALARIEALGSMKEEAFRKVCRKVQEFEAAVGEMEAPRAVTH